MPTETYGSTSEYTILDRVQSSDGTTEYEIRRSHRTAEVYCSCPGWRFSGRRNGGQHTCRHLTDYNRRVDAAREVAIRETVAATVPMTLPHEVNPFGCAFCSDRFATQRALDVHMGVCAAMASAIAPRRPAARRSRPMHVVEMDGMVRRARVIANGLGHAMNAFARDYESGRAVGVCDTCRESVTVWRDPVSGQDQRQGLPLNGRCAAVGVR